MKLKKTHKSSSYTKIEILDGKKSIGRAFLYLIKNDLHKQPYGLMEDVFVDEKYRSQGLGRKLVSEIIKFAKKYKCTKLIGTSRMQRKNVHNFYQRQGFKKWGYEFRMDLINSKPKQRD